MFLHLSVSHSVHRGVGSAHPPQVGKTPQMQTPSRCRHPRFGQTPLDVDSPRVGQTPWMQTPQVGQTPLDADPPGLGRTPPPRCRPPPDADSPWMQTPPGWVDPPGCRPPWGWADPPPPRYGQQVGGMHPTRMHTC